jgi:hypothetical protein
MSIPIWLSVDFDYFVRYLPQFDWAHQESPFFQGGAMWMIRVASHHSAGGDLREDMDPQRYATPKPQSFFNVLQQLGYDFGRTGYVGLADSHAMAGPVFRQLGEVQGVPDLLVSFDAHHDLGYHGWSRTQEFIEQDQCSCDMWLCAVLCWYNKLRANIIYPPWQTKKDLGWERKSIRDNLPTGPMRKRVKADLFSHDGTVSDLVKPPPGETFDVRSIFVCRSSAWVPPWLDEDFNEFVETIEDELNLFTSTPGVDEGMAEDPKVVRADFDYDAAVQQGEQMRMMMELGPDGFREMVEELKAKEDDEPEENPEVEEKNPLLA